MIAGVPAGWQAQDAGISIDFTTSQGKPRAFPQGDLESPRNLWIVCGGNGTVAPDRADWIQTHAPREDAWLLLDFPGYGDRARDRQARSGAGNRSDRRYRRRRKRWAGPGIPIRRGFFGHSLGGAACLIAASEFGIQRGVLIAPLTGTMDMANGLTGLPPGFLVSHRYDNSARLAELAARGAGEVIIIHGGDDGVIPVSMSRTPANERNETVRLTEIPGGRHNTVQATHADKVAKALRDAGEWLV